MRKALAASWVVCLAVAVPVCAQSRANQSGEWHSFRSSSSYDAQSEAVLLDLANQARAEAGVPPLQPDAGLTRAAREHSLAMAKAHQLTHQLEGEASLVTRMAAATQLTMEHEGENVALDQDARTAAEGLMHSPPHRKNILDPDFNVVGIGVVTDGAHLWVTEDFGGSVASYSAEEAENIVAGAVGKFRGMAKLPALQRASEPGLREAACSMAKSDGLSTLDTHQWTQGYEVVAYTSMHPEALPSEARRFLSGHQTNTFAVGACHGRTKTYPLGVYWVMLLFH